MPLTTKPASGTYQSIVPNVSGYNSGSNGTLLSYPFTGSYTFSFWFKLGALPASGDRAQLFMVPLYSLLSADTYIGEFYSLSVDSSGTLVYSSTIGQIDTASSSGVIAAGQWINLTATASFVGSTGTYNAYLNGTNVISASHTIGAYSSDESPIRTWQMNPCLGLEPGAPLVAYSATNAYFNNFSFWPSSLGSSDIAALATSYPPLTPPSIAPDVAYEFSQLGMQLGDFVPNPSSPTYYSAPANFYNLSLNNLSVAMLAPPLAITGPASPFGFGYFVSDQPTPGPTPKGRKRFSFLPAPPKFLSDSATFTGLASATFVGPIAVAATSSATFTGLASETAGHSLSATSSATFTGLATGGVHGLHQLPADSATFTGLASSAVLYAIAASASDSAVFGNVAGYISVGSKSANAAGGARFFDTAGANAATLQSASDSATFTDNLAVNGIFVHASDSATFTGLAAAIDSSHASDSATFSDSARGGGPIALSASDSATFTGLASGYQPVVHTQRVSDSFYFLFTLASAFDTTIFVSAMDTARFTDLTTNTGYFQYAALASDSAYVSQSLTATFKRAYTDVPQGTVGSFADQASCTVLRVYRVSASDSARVSSSVGVDSETVFPSVSMTAARFTDRATENRIAIATQADSATFTAVVSAGVAHTKSASDSATFTGLSKSNQFLSVSASDSATFTGLSAETVEHLGATSLATFSDQAAVSVVLPGGSLVPGGDQALGLRTVIWPTLSTEYPASCVESAEGYLLVATGMDPVIAWDGTSPSAWQAGMTEPDQVVWLDGVGSGPLVGRRLAYLRWIDERGNTSNLSQVSDPVELGHDGWIHSVSYSSVGVVTIASPAHGLFSGNTVTVSCVGGLPAVSGQWAITVTGADSFTLNGLVVTGGTYTTGGVWTYGVLSISYTNVAVPTDPKVVRRQLLRNLSGNADVFYVDVDTTDLVSTSFSSSLTDEQLATKLAVPILFKDDSNAAARLFQGGFPAANRFGAPPSWKCALAAYSGRVFAAADRIYGTGNASCTYGSPYVVGIGTNWTASIAGRLLCVSGVAPQTIDCLIQGQQILKLETPYQGPSQVFGYYYIRPAPVERLLVYYSEPHLCEAWPPWNAFSVPETSDEIVGLFVMRSFLFILKERNIFKFAFKEDPGRDGYVFPLARRGCINNRCYAYVEDKTYILDEMGIYSFDGDAIEPVSEDVQVLFTPDGSSLYQVDWTTDRTFWHAAHDQQRETIRWFLDLVGQASLTMAICYNYRRGSWWLEQFAEPVFSSALAVVSGSKQSIMGGTGRRVYCVGQGTLDGIQENVTGTLRGTATGSDSLSITDSTATFPSNLAGVPVALVSGTGAGQQAIVSSNTSTAIEIVDPWQIVPDTTTVYQIGGVQWTWKSGWRQFVDDEASNPRDLEFVFQPTPNPSTVNARVYYDNSTEPHNWASDLERDGIKVVAGTPNITIELATPRGYAIQRMAGHRDPYGYGHRYLALELTGVQGLDPQRVYQLVINGVE